MFPQVALSDPSTLIIFFLVLAPSVGRGEPASWNQKYKAGKTNIKSKSNGVGKQSIWLGNK